MDESPYIAWLNTLGDTSNGNRRGGVRFCKPREQKKQYTAVHQRET